MKKILFLLLLSCSSLYGSHTCTYPSLQAGVYMLEGTNINSSRINYHGEVEIRPNGSTFLVVWKIGNVQTQTGVGILRNGTLSVAFYDLSGTGCGVVSYIIKDSESLEGIWAPYPSSCVGREWLTFLHP